MWITLCEYRPGRMSAALALWMLYDWFKTDTTYSEETLTSSREGEIEAVARKAQGLRSMTWQTQQQPVRLPQRRIPPHACSAPPMSGRWASASCWSANTPAGISQPTRAARSPHSIICWVVGLLYTSVAMIDSEVTSTVAAAGGQYAQAKHIVGPLMAFNVGALPGFCLHDAGSVQRHPDRRHDRVTVAGEGFGAGLPGRSSC